MATKKNTRRRNFANDIVDASEAAAKRALRALQDRAKRSAAASAAAAQRTQERLNQDFQNDKSLRARLLRQRLGDKAPGANRVPTQAEINAMLKKQGVLAAQPYGPGGSPDGSGLGQAQQNPLSPEQRIQMRAAAAPAPKTAQPGIARRVAEAPASPAPVGPSVHAPRVENVAPAFPVAPASETYRDGGKGLYQGTKAYRDAIGGSGNPLLNRFRRDMGLDPATGNRASAPTRAQDRIPHNPGATISEPLTPALSAQQQLLRSHDPGGIISEPLAQAARVVAASNAAAQAAIDSFDPNPNAPLNRTGQSLFEEMQRRRRRQANNGQA